MTVPASPLEYTVTPEGVITDIAEPAWNSAVPTDRPELCAAALIGRPLFRFIAGPEVVASFRAFHEALLRGVLAEVSIPFRCDGPGVVRDMRLLIHKETEGRDRNRQKDGPRLRYTSILLGERPSVDLAPELFAEPGTGSVIVKMCSYCKRVCLPPGQEEGAWIPAELYRAHGGPACAAMSHGICALCRASVIEPVLQRLRARGGVNGSE